MSDHSAPKRSTNKKRSKPVKRTISINGIRPQIAFLAGSAAFYSLVFFMPHGAVISTVLGTLTALTSRCSLTIDRSEVATIHWHVLWIPIGTRTIGLSSYSKASASEQLDFIGLVLFAVIAILLTMLIMAFGLLMLPIVFIFILYFPLRIVLAASGHAPSRANDVLNHMISVVDIFGVGQAVYRIDLSDDSRKKTNLCRRLSRRQADQAIKALNRYCSLRIQELPPDSPRAV